MNKCDMKEITIMKPLVKKIEFEIGDMIEFENLFNAGSNLYILTKPVYSNDTFVLIDVGTGEYYNSVGNSANGLKKLMKTYGGVLFKNKKIRLSLEVSA